MKQTDFFDFVPVEEVGVKANPVDVIREISNPCRNCRLGQIADKNNNGFIFTGTPQARLAFLGDMPEVEGTLLSKRLPIAGETMRELSKWLAFLKVSEDDVFMLNVVQCKTTKSKAKDAEPRLPFNEEIDACFPDRALRVLQSLPNLQVVVTLGWTSAAALIGRNPEPRVKTHEGVWFGTDFLPGVAVYCLDHPREYVGEKASPKKTGRLMQCLDFFSTEYIRPETSKIMQILKLREAERRSS